MAVVHEIEWKFERENFNKLEEEFPQQ